MGSVWSINEILKVTQGRLIFHDPLLSLNRTFLEIQIDSRKPMKNKAFLALKGSVFDGHHFIGEAYKKGAKLLIIDSLDSLLRLGSLTSKHSKVKNLKHKNFNIKEIKNWIQKLGLKQVSLIQVRDTLNALTLLAQHCREKKIKKAKIIAITGSAGKTTTKGFTKTILEKSLKVYASPKSFNNHLGVPLALLEAPPESRVIILEIGMNRKGEIEKLCRLAKPHFCLVTNVGLAHRGHFKSQMEIAREKEKLYSKAPKKAHFVFNYDHFLTQKMFKKFKKKKKGISFFSSEEEKAHVFMKPESFTWNSIKVRGHIQGIKGSSRVRIFGKQNVFNLMGASALALKLQVPPKKIWSSLRYCKSLWGRNEFITLPSGIQVLFDAYNASPESVFALLENFYAIKEKEERRRVSKKVLKGKKKRVAIFAEMMELGNQSKKLHYEWGEKSRALNFEYLWFLGSHFKSFKKGLEEKTKENSHSIHLPVRCYFTKDYQERILKKMISPLKKGDFILIKGSRAMKLERVLDDLKRIDQSR